MDVQDLLWGKGPKLHVTDGEARSFSISDALLLYLDKAVGKGSRTLETGCGVSSVLFAMKGARHTCIAPFQEEIAGIRAFCAENNISDDATSYIVEQSQVALPRLAPEPLDLVLIDGAHGFPVPMIDWFFTADRLQIGGTLILDDVGIWSVNVLKQFLMDEPEWRLDSDMWPRSAVFTRVTDGTSAKNAFNQPHVVTETIKLLSPDHIDMIRPYIKPDVLKDL